jgi:hypothetical protein
MKRRILLLLAVPLILCACGPAAVTRDEAIDAVNQASVAGQSDALVATPVELSTHFTTRGAVAAAVAELRAFLAAELPCATVTVQGSTITTEWGAAGGSCTYRGQAYSGVSSVTIGLPDPSAVSLTHTFTDLSNGRITMNGTAVVTWSGAAQSRVVAHRLSWTRLRDNRTGSGTGVVTEVLIDPAQGIAGGVRIDGSRQWTADRGAWDLAIAAIEVRPQDPIPQAGVYQLTTPDDKELTLTFTRESAYVIRVTVSGPKHDFSFTVGSTGAIEGG